MKSFLIIGTVTEHIRSIAKAFTDGSILERVRDLEMATKLLAEKHFDVLFWDIQQLASTSWKADYGYSLKTLRHLYPSLPIVILVPTEKVRMAMQAIKAGADDYLTDSMEVCQVKYVIENLNRLATPNSEIKDSNPFSQGKGTFEITYTANERMKQVFAKMRSVAPTRTTVLLVGETGTGKSLMARLIHQHSNRDKAPFISLHCGAIPDTLIESELFGHEKGAFTGAVRTKRGKFENARGGTIFLDEIATISPSLQIKLLQVLQDGTFSKVGGEKILVSNTRIIAATNADLRQMTADKLFRSDLYYRLNVFPIEIPPLRERWEDIPHLINRFLARLNSEMMKGIHEIHPQVIKALVAYHWPGNIRELENIIERAFILETSSVLTPEGFPAELFEITESTPTLPVDIGQPLAEARRQAIADFERSYLKALLSENKGKVNKSAAHADISTRQLHKLMLKYGLRKEDFKR